MPEAVRASWHPWLAGFGRAWKPDLLNKIGDFSLGVMLCGLGEIDLA
ncbi:MAG: hypothetical protein VB089_19085 [Anaerolineaceae bacterium]|jgi:hypothetical protein|nr:hypothetical protein [Anaerolineaceae bacterium]